MNRLGALLKRSDLSDDIVTVSPSQLSLWHTCQHKWNLSKRGGYHSFRMTSKAADLGSMFHKFAEAWYEMFLGRQVQELSSQQLVDFMTKVERENEWTDYESQLKLMNVFTVFTSYMRYASLHETLLPLGVEVETFAPTGLRSVDGRDIYLHGIIDLVAETIDGRVGPVDHKSHTSRPWNREEVAFDLQIFFYMLLLTKQGIFTDFGAINTVDLSLPRPPRKGADAAYYAKLQVSLNDPGRFARHVVTHTQFSLDQFETQIYSIIRKMHCTPGYEYDMRIDRNCARCGFHEPCEMTLRGEEPVHLLNTKYKENATLKVIDWSPEPEADEESYVLP